MDFDKAFDVLIGHEGGYTDDRRDPGNWTGGKVGSGALKGTKFGIAANTYGQLDIKNLTVAQAKEIYRRDFWDRMQLQRLPPEVRFDLFDAAVNSGVGRANRFLQAAVGVKQDGIVGPVTLAAANKMLPLELDKKINGHRLLFMASLSVWPSFARGWARRIANNLIED